MTKEELKSKLDAAQERVDKRIATISKSCKKLGLYSNDILEKAKTFTRPYNYAHIKEFFNIPTEDPEQYRVDGSTTDKWGEVYERNQKIRDLYDSIFKLKELEEIRDNWKVKYDTQVNKENAPKIQVLVDFLNDWKRLAYDWYVENCKYAVRQMNKFHQEAYKYLNDTYGWDELSYREKYAIGDTGRIAFNNHMNEMFGARPRYSRSYASENDMLTACNISSFTQDIMSTHFESRGSESFGQCFGHQEYPGEYVLRSINETLLKKTLEKEAQAKYEDLCNRITSVVGEIEDVSYLHIAHTGQLNGIVKGSLGSAKVETIGAGGYNIQCFHYRTLVHKL